jgi:hypothetical protein
LTSNLIRYINISPINCHPFLRFTYCPLFSKDWRIDFLLSNINDLIDFWIIKLFQLIFKNHSVDRWTIPVIIWNWDWRSRRGLTWFRRLSNLDCRIYCLLLLLLSFIYIVAKMLITKYFRFRHLFLGLIPA